MKNMPLIQFALIFLFLFPSNVFSNCIRGDCLNGQGIVRYSSDQSGYVYEGEFNNGAMSGNGRMTFFNGEIQEGVFFNGLLNGQGMLIDSEGRLYEGKWQNGLIKMGTLKYPDGKKYTGEFYSWKPDGLGEMIHPNGKLSKGRFKNGHYVGVEQNK